VAHHAVRIMLSEIYGWFAEEFDTKDLQEAKVLIEELSHRALRAVFIRMGPGRRSG